MNYTNKRYHPSQSKLNCGYVRLQNSVETLAEVKLRLRLTLINAHSQINSLPRRRS